MTTKRIVLWCCIVLLLASPVVAYQFFWEELMRMVGMQMNPAVMDHDAMVQNPAVRERVEYLRKQTLDESFAELLDGQQYFVFIPPSSNRPRDIRQLLSSRTFLKVFQQFGELPKGQALEKLYQFSERAVQEYANVLGFSSVGIAAQKEDPSMSILEVFERVTGRFSIRGAKYMLGATMLLAARMGEYELLVYQVNTMQSLTDEYLEKIGAGPDSAYRLIVPLEDDCIFTLLMYALERKEGTLDVDVDVSPFIIFTPSVQQQQLDFHLKQAAEGVAVTPFPSHFNLQPETVPLARWDASEISYEYYGITNPRDAIDQITVYTFGGGWLGGSGRDDNIQIQLDKQMQIVLNSLKERLSR